MYYVGIDWADQKHDIVVLDEPGKEVAGPFTIEKSPKGFDQLLVKLRKLSYEPTAFKIGIETPHNLLVDFLIDMGYSVFTIFPGAMKSFRQRYRSSGARDDGFDAFVISDVLRTDRRCWRKIDFGSDLVRQIRILASDHHQLVDIKTAMTNRLRSTLKAYYPEYIQFFSDVACSSSLAFLLACPDFDSAAQRTLEQLSDFFKEQNLHNGKKVHQIYKILHNKHLKVPQTLVQTKKYMAISCAQSIKSLVLNVEKYTMELQSLVTRHPDSEIFLSYPGVGLITAARLLAFFGDNRNLYSDVSELQSFAGTCPVTEKSGKNYNVTYYRRACNKFFRDVMYNLAFASLTKAKWAMAYYKKHKSMGKKHNHALRCLANLHLRILFAMWKNKTKYDENIFLAQKTRLFIK